MKDFSPEKLKNYRSYYVHKVTVPLPYTFGCLSFGRGDISTNQIMEEAGFSKLVHAHYTRLNIVTVYQNYAISAYGIP